MRILAELAVAQFSSVLASTGVTFLTALWLGPSGRGTLAFMLGLANLIGAMCFGSLHVGAANAYQHGDGTSIRRTIRLGGLAAVVAFLVVAVGAAARALDMVTFSTAHALLLAGIGACGVTINLVVLRTVQGVGDTTGFKQCWLIQSGVYSVLGIGSAFFWRQPDVVMYAWFVGVGLSTLRGLQLLSERSANNGQVVPTSWLLKNSLVAHAAIVGNQLLFRSDTVFLGVLSSPSELGVYSVAVPLASVGWIVSEAAALAAFVQGRHDNENDARALRMLLFVNAGVCAATGLAALVLSVVLSNTLLTKYPHLPILVAVLLPGVVVQGSSRIIAGKMAATSAYRPLLLMGLGSTLLCLLYIPACIEWGALGAAATSSIVYCIQSILVAWLWRRSRAEPVRVLAEDTH